jgi:hypothetical protein
MIGCSGTSLLQTKYQQNTFMIDQVALVSTTYLQQKRQV